MVGFRPSCSSAISARRRRWSAPWPRCTCRGVSSRKVKAVTEALCGHSFSASAISNINKSLDEALRAFAHRRLNEPFPYLILDARYERVREAGVDH